MGVNLDDEKKIDFFLKLTFTGFGLFLFFCFSPCCFFFFFVFFFWFFFLLHLNKKITETQVSIQILLE